MSRHGIDRFGKPLDAARPLRRPIPGVLRAGGYWTGYVGKYDVGTPRPGDFDFVRAYHGQHWLKTASGERIHVTEKNAQDSLEFLRARPRERPFLLSVGYFAAHAEDQASEQYLPQDWSAAATSGRACRRRRSAIRSFSRRCRRFSRANRTKGASATTGASTRPRVIRPT